MEQKVELRLEYVINSSPRILFPFIQEPNALAQWFADDVNYKDGIYEFIWEDEVNRAKLAAVKENKSVRFKWLDDTPYYFEIEIIQDELTNDVALHVTDYVKPDNLDDRKKIWNNSIEYLQSVIGA
ncbi:START-like domain-containing protein [Sphingobacterium sp. UT-1RO-CII-1]|uniref:START-like domain-containing protein n=1 Tax=Sphingobacterium sp. UT-1RO-CII-1 TaxID=2995225 RepID=UPI00227BB805|nr:START-like domain-containing protein [Sphingobacterium sp. UT-1RO-CII-1]MCY4779820.1 START-like domain-containing protein [Sphingobacterium sp. UT-1RO-CII-1]